MAVKYRWIKVDRDSDMPSVGDLVTLVRHENLLTGERSYTLDGPDGSPGNSDPNILRYHGWRGTTNDWHAEALGQRRVLDVCQDPQDHDHYEVRLGKDLHPDWE
jgi:hypothetical protein